MAFTDWDEATGSPEIDVFIDHQHAVRTGFISWANIDSLVSELFPTDGSPSASLPGYESLRAISCHIKPIVGESTKTSTGVTTALSVMNSYSQAKVVIEYGVDNRFYEEDQSGADPVTLLTHRWSIGGEFLTLPSESFEWCDGEPVTGDMTFGILVPTVEHQITWPRVQNPPFAAIRDLVGSINNANLDFKTGTIPPETLLFLGAELQRDILSNGTLGWEVTYRFSERSVSTNEGCLLPGVSEEYPTIGGWNHFYRADDPSESADPKMGFYRLEKASGLNAESRAAPYLEGDFSTLFVEATP